MSTVSLIVYPAADLAESKRFFRELLGCDPYVDSPYYVGYRTGDMEIGLVPDEHKHAAGALAYWNVADIAARVRELVNAGGTVVQEVTDVGSGMLIARIRDANGAVVGLRQPPEAS